MKEDKRKLWPLSDPICAPRLNRTVSMLCNCHKIKERRGRYYENRTKTVCRSGRYDALSRLCPQGRNR